MEPSGHLDAANRVRANLIPSPVEATRCFIWRAPKSTEAVLRTLGSRPREVSTVRFLRGESMDVLKTMDFPKHTAECTQRKRRKSWLYFVRPGR